MKNHFVWDFENDLFMAMDVEHAVANFVCSCLLNTCSISYSPTVTRSIIKLKEETVSHLPTIVFRNDDKFKVLEEIVLKPDQYLRYKAGATLATGYEFLLDHCNRIEAQYEHISSLELSDIPLYKEHRSTYVALYAKTNSISNELAEKQLDLDYENTMALIMRRKEILWMYGNMLRSVKNDQDLASWQTKVYDSIIGVGAV